MSGFDIPVAYIDPGTGSFLLQSAIAGFIGVFFYFRNGIKRIADRLFRRNRTLPPEDHTKPKV